MKKISLVIGSLLAVQAASAQISIDPEVGLNVSNISSAVGDNDPETRDSKVGMNVGLGFNIGLYKGLYIKPGIQYTMLGDQADLLVGHNTTTYHYLRIPVNLGYRFDLPGNSGAIFLEAGPYVGFGLSGKSRTENLPIIGALENDIEFGGDNNETNPLDFGFNFGGGYETPWGIYFKANYGLGVANMSNSDNFTAQHRVWNFNLGYRIKL